LKKYGCELLYHGEGFSPKSQTQPLHYMGSHVTRIVSWFESYLSSRKIRVVIDGHSSNWQQIHAGVPQGSILGPLLFLIYINDIVKDIECHISLYADDTSLYIDYNATDKQEKLDALNRDLNRLNNWSKEWFMNFNPQKTQYIRFHGKYRIPGDPNICLNRTRLEEAQSHCHLGLILTSDLDFTKHIDHLITKCSKWIGLMWKLQRKYPRHCIENIYTAYIRPVIEYGHIIFDNISETNSQRLEAIQRKAAIACTGAYINTSHARLLAELGWPSLKQRREGAKLTTMFKMVNGLSPRYLQDLLPAQRDPEYQYQLRNTPDITQPKTRLQSFRKSFIPDTIYQWNHLQPDIRNAPSLYTFKKKLKSRMGIPKIKVYSMGCGSGSIHLARIRMNMSGLNLHLFDCNIVQSKNCSCSALATEDVDHFFWICPRYVTHRQTMILDLHTIITDLLPLPTTKIERINITRIIVNGDINRTTYENISIFHIVEKYITNTKRFM